MTQWGPAERLRFEVGLPRPGVPDMRLQGLGSAQDTDLYLSEILL
jgi:hypothetical protein